MDVGMQLTSALLDRVGGERHTAAALKPGTRLRMLGGPQGGSERGGEPEKRKFLAPQWGSNPDHPGSRKSVLRLRYTGPFNSQKKI